MEAVGEMNWWMNGNLMEIISIYGKVYQGKKNIGMLESLDIG